MRRLRLMRTYIDMYCPLTISRHAPVPFSGPALLFPSVLNGHVRAAGIESVKRVFMSVKKVSGRWNNKNKFAAYNKTD